MVKHALWIVLLASGCFDDRYRCVTDEQCDLGEGGRCELDGYCTVHDLTCPTRRRYAAHAGELTDRCYDDGVAPLDACAGGQPAAPREGCFATVCDRLPACCAVAWTDACAQVAQESCNVTCDTRIAVTASRGITTELWDVRWEVDHWTFAQRVDLSSLAWVGPAPGTSEPRLGGSTPTELAIGDTRIPVPADRSYNSITSVAFDRNGHDVIAAGFAVSGAHSVELWDLTTQSVREVRIPGSEALAWGDVNRDDFADGVSKNGAQYNYVENFEDDSFGRKLANQTVSNVSGGQTPGSPQIRAADWLDFDGDGKLDLAVFGNSVRVHTSADGLRDVPERDYDCIPPDRARGCSVDPEPNLESVSFAGAALPTAAAPSLVVTTFPGRKLFRIGTDSVTALPFPGDTCSCTANCTNCPGTTCTCTYNCTMCVPVLAIVARDLDADRALDLVAIDARLQVFTAFAATGYTFGTATQIPTSSTQNFFNIVVSVTGAPIP